MPQLPSNAIDVMLDQDFHVKWQITDFWLKIPWLVNTVMQSKIGQAIISSSLSLSYTVKFLFFLLNNVK